MNDASGQEKEDEDDVRPIEELVEARANGLEREGDDEGQESVALHNEPLARDRVGALDRTHDDTRDEAVPLKHGYEHRTTKWVLVDDELTNPSGHMPSREQPNHSTCQRKD